MTSVTIVKTRRHYLAVSIAFGVALLVPMEGALAQATGERAMALDSQDRKFIETAAEGGLAEVTMGEIAQRRGANAQVKAFGQRMVEDHSKANSELKRVASAKGLPLPTSLDKGHQEHADALAKLSGADFDRAYMKHMVDDHQKTIKDFDTAAKTAKDADVKGFAARTLPTLNSHLELALKTQEAVK